MSYITGLITERAKQHFQEWDKDAKSWVNIWFKTAEEMRAEFVKEGLDKTVSELDNIVSENRRVVEPHDRGIEMNNMPQKPAEKPVEKTRERYDENVLPDDYPIFVGFFYRIGDKVYISDYHDISVGALKNILGVEEIRRYDLVKRGAAGAHLEIYKV